MELLELLHNQPGLLLLLIVPIAHMITTDVTRTLEGTYQLKSKAKKAIKAVVKTVCSKIVTTSISRLDKATVDVISRSTCGNNHTCLIAARDINLQKVVYRLVITHIFMDLMVEKLLEAIADNGFHELSESEYRGYINTKGVALYEWSIQLLRDELQEICPDIFGLIGNNFSNTEAVEAFRYICDTVKGIDDRKIKDIDKWNKSRSLLMIFSRLKKEL